jgi:hypothetical protein
MHRSFIRAGRLKSWLTRPGCPPAIQECKRIFDKLVGNAYDTQTEHPMPPTPPAQLDEESISSPEIARWQHGRIGFARSSTHRGNSQILFYAGGDRHTPPVPGVIKSIQLRGERVVFMANRYLPVADEVVDPFRHYPHMEIKLYSAVLEPDEFVELDWILAHFASYPFQQDCVAIVSLSRVSFSTLDECNLLIPPQD